MKLQHETSRGASERPGADEEMGQATPRGEGETVVGGVGAVDEGRAGGEGGMRDSETRTPGRQAGPGDNESAPSTQKDTSHSSLVLLCPCFVASLLDLKSCRPPLDGHGADLDSDVWRTPKGSSSRTPGGCLGHPAASEYRVTREWKCPISPGVSFQTCSHARSFLIPVQAGSRARGTPAERWPLQPGLHEQSSVSFECAAEDEDGRSPSRNTKAWIREKAFPRTEVERASAAFSPSDSPAARFCEDAPNMICACSSLDDFGRTWQPWTCRGGLVPAMGLARSSSR